MAQPRRQKTKPAQYRLPAWAHEFLAEEAALYGITKTEVIVRGLEKLRDAELESLMAEGYRECADENRRLAEEGMESAREILPDW